MKLYIGNKNYSSWSLRPWVLMHMLGIDFEEILVPFEGSGPQRAFQEFSPSGKVPCLVDGRLTVWDSLAIIEFLAERHPAAWPANREVRAWARSASAEMHSGFPLIRGVCSMSCGQRIRLEDPPAGLDTEWRRVESLWAEGLDRFGGPYLAGGDFTAVDAMYAPVAFRILGYSPALAPEALDYASRLRALPPMRRWYTEALAETFRDVDHDREIEAVGAVLQDLRAEAE